jgi:lipoprotein-anchoring transpeptidase ErfK/SrfK
MLTFLIGISPMVTPGLGPSKGDPYIVINKKTNELTFFKDGQAVVSAPVATGKTNDLTPEGMFTVLVKAKDPYYRKKDIPGGDPQNPLGSRWIGFDAKETDGRIYGIHGTNQPWSIGKYQSNGCVRMQNQDVNHLFDLIPLGTKVRITYSDQSAWVIAKADGVV